MRRAILAARSRSLISDSGNSELLFNVEIRNMGTDTVYVNARIHGILTRLNALSPERVRHADARTFWRSLPVRTFLSAEWTKLTARVKVIPPT